MLGEEAADVADGAPESIEGSGLCLSQVRLELGEGHFYGIEIGAVGWQEQEPGAFLSEAVGSFGALVDGEVVEDDDVALAQGRSKLCLDVGVESRPIHRFVDDPWSGQAIASERRNKGLRTPMAERGVRFETLSLEASSAQTGHFRSDGSFVNEHQTARLIAHAWLAGVAPSVPGLGDVSAFAFRGQQRFFYM